MSNHYHTDFRLRGASGAKTPGHRLHGRARFIPTRSSTQNGMEMHIRKSHKNSATGMERNKQV